MGREKVSSLLPFFLSVLLDDCCRLLVHLLVVLMVGFIFFPLDFLKFSLSMVLFGDVVFEKEETQI